MKKLGKKMKEQKNTLKAFACTCDPACSLSYDAKVSSHQYYYSK